MSPDDVVDPGEPHPVPLPRDPPPPPGWQDPISGSEALDELRIPSAADPTETGPDAAAAVHEVPDRVG